MVDKILGKIFFGVTVIGMVMLSARIYFVEDMNILIWIGIPMAIIGAVGTCLTSKKLRKYLIDLLDLL